MNTLGTMAMGLMLGDSAVAAYLDIARCKNCGCGLFQQTTNSSYRVMNTKNNYPRTASYYNIQRRLSETPMPMKRFFNGNIVSAFNVDGMDIGWAYTTDLNQNKLSRGYVSSADFDEFQRLLRGEQIYRNYIEDSYSKIGVDKKSNITPLDRGDEYKDRTENVRQNHGNIPNPEGLNIYIQKNEEIKNKAFSYKDKTISLPNKLFLDNLRLGLTLDSVYSSMIPMQAWMNKAISEHGDKYKLSNFSVDNGYGDIKDFSIKGSEDFLRISQNGGILELLEYYKTWIKIHKRLTPLQKGTTKFENIDDGSNTFEIIREYKNEKVRVLVNLKKYEVKIID